MNEVAFFRIYSRYIVWNYHIVNFLTEIEACKENYLLLGIAMDIVIAVTAIRGRHHQL